MPRKEINEKKNAIGGQSFSAIANSISSAWTEERMLGVKMAKRRIESILRKSFGKHDCCGMQKKNPLMLESMCYVIQLSSLME